jgi:hypothetical protein
MARELWWARLASSSPRYKDWFQILGTDKVPLLHPGDAECNFIGEGAVHAHRLALDQLDDQQLNRLFAFVAKKFGADEETVRNEVLRDGFPVRSEDVTIFYDTRAFL